MSGVILGYGDMDLRIIKRLRPLARTTSQYPHTALILVFCSLPLNAITDIDA